jgi:hypothetical protein
MTERTGQLLSTRIQNLAGEAAGHNYETAHNEITFDNPLDVGSNSINLFISKENSCFGILDNGPGIENIWHLLGEGEGLKIKSGGKIGNKIAGELASGTFFQADKTMYFSRSNENNITRKHQQLNIQYNKMVSIVKTPDMDVAIADKIISYGDNRLVRKPEPDRDKFDNDNVEYVKMLFKNHESIMTYFDTNVSGMVKVFIFEGENRIRFEQMLNELPKIISKVEFITYNTLNGFRGTNEFKYIDTDNNIIRTINSESCKANFILGRKAIIYETDEDYYENSCITDEIFGLMSVKTLYVNNYFYEKNGNIYNKCVLYNYFGEEFLIDSNVKVQQLNKVTNTNILDIISDDDNLVGKIPMYVSFVDKDEAEKQRDLMNESSTLESMKQVYVYYHGRYLARDKLINIIPGFQERSLPHFRIVMCINEDTTKYLNIRAQKSSISLSKAHPLIQKTIQEIIKPIICKLYEKDSKMIQNGINNWDNHKNDVLSLINTGKLVTVSAAPTTVPPTPVPRPPPPTPPPTIPIPPPTYRGPSPVVYASLNKTQTISQLQKLKNTLNIGQKYRTKKDKTKIITLLNKIEREIILDDDMMDEKIDNLIILLSEVEKTPNEPIKHATELQDF